MIKCSECSGDLSSLASACPHCGAPSSGKAEPAVMETQQQVDKTILAEKHRNQYIQYLRNVNSPSNTIQYYVALIDNLDDIFEAEVEDACDVIDSFMNTNEGEEYNQKNNGNVKRALNIYKTMINKPHSYENQVISHARISDKSRIIAGILGIFLGGFGVHSFYTGRTGRGFVQLFITLFTCGIGGIWGFIEGIIIICSHEGSTMHQDAWGNELRD